VINSKSRSIVQLSGATAKIRYRPTSRVTSGIKPQEARDKRQEAGDRRQETGGRRQEAGDRRQETGDRRQEARC